jgi:hypothetical protein
MLKALWIPLLCTSIVYTAVAWLVVYDLYLFIPLAVLAVILEVALWLMLARWLAKRPLRPLLKIAGRHWLLLLGVLLGGIIVLSPLCAFVSLPAIILILAEWESQEAIAIGDPITIPATIPYMVAVTCFISIFLELCIRLFIVYVAYYACGSAETKKREREEQIRSLSSTL